MKKWLPVFLLLLHISPYLPTQCAGQTDEGSSILKYLPSEESLGGWKTLYEPETAEGEDLYLLINGGAEIYYEYGFKRTITQSYENQNGKSINLEIYEMESPESAYGIFTFKIGNNGKQIAVGNDAFLESYYLNFWKGNFLVTLIGFDSEKETLDGLVTMAKAVDAKIEDIGQKPPITKLFLEENLQINHITYLRGNLALFNQYQFDTANIFGLTEGVVGNYGNFQVFVFRYKDKNESMKWFKNAINNLQNNSRFKDFLVRTNGFSMKDEKDQIIRAEPYLKYILIFLGTTKEDARTALEQIKDRLHKGF